MKETAPERTASDLPEKDNMKGKKEAIAPLVKKKMKCKTVEIVARFADFETKTRAKSLPHYTNDYETLWQQALSLFLPFLDERENPHKKLIRLVGVSLSHLQKIDNN